MRSLTANRQGLTLIEILVATTIMAFLVVSVVVATNQALDNKILIIREDRELLQVETALDRLNWDFSQIYTPLYHTRVFKLDPNARSRSKRKLDLLQANPLYEGRKRFRQPDFYGRPIPVITQDGKEAIEFFTKANRRRFENSDESEFAWVRYEFRPYSGEDEDKQELFELVRFYAAGNIYHAELELQDLPATVLMNQVSEYAFLFWDEQNKKWEKNLGSVRRGKSILRGLKLEIKWRRGADQIEEFSSKTCRTIWPYFSPENLYSIRSQRQQ